MTWWKAVLDALPLSTCCDLIKEYTDRQRPGARRRVIDTSTLAGRVPAEILDPKYKTPDYIDDAVLELIPMGSFGCTNTPATFIRGSTTIQKGDEAPCLSGFIIKYTNLQGENHAGAARARPQSHIGDAFGATADYRSLKYDLEKLKGGSTLCNGWITLQGLHRGER